MIININGTIQSNQTTTISLQNRAFRYGDSLFESLRMFNSKLPFWELHYQRLLQGMKVLQFDILPHYTLDFFKKEIQKLCSQINDGNNYRIRLMVFRSEGGLYTPSNNTPQFFIEAKPYPHNHFIEQKGIEVGVFDSVRLSYDVLSSSKTGNGLPYILASIHRQKKGWGDCLMLNSYGRVAESSNANIFVVFGNKLYTPPLSEGCLAGTTRKVLLEIAKKDFDIIEQPLTVQKLLTANEVLLTNASMGLRYIAQIGDTTFGNTAYFELLKLLNFKVQNSTFK